jgi:hypothetical protein
MTKTMTNTMETWMEFQKDTMAKFLEMSTTSKDLKNTFNPLEVFNQFKSFEGKAGNTKKINENNLKYHKAFIAYHQAMHDMMEAINDNTALMPTEKK